MHNRRACKIKSGKKNDFLYVVVYLIFFLKHFVFVFGAILYSVLFGFGCCCQALLL